LEPEDGHKHLVFLTAVESRASIEIVYQLLLLFKEDLIPGYWFEVVVFEGKESLVGLMRDFCPQMAIVDAEIVFESRSEIGSGIEAIAQLRKNYPQLPIMVMTTEKRGSEKIIGPDGRQTDRPKVKRSPDEIIKVKVIDKPLIEKATFEKAQALMKSKNRRYHAKRSKAGERFLYSGFLKCGCCGEIMYSTSGGRNHQKDYYLCRSKNYFWQRKNGPSECKTKYLSRVTVDHSVTSFVAETLTDKEYLESVINAAISTEKFQEQKAESEMLQGMRVKLKSKRDKLLDLYSDGLFSKIELNKKVSDLNDQEATIKYRLAKIQEAERLKPDLILDAIEPIITTLAEFPFWTPKQKRTFMKSQLPEITVTNEGISGILLGVPTPRNRTGMDSWQPPA